MKSQLRTSLLVTAVAALAACSGISYNSDYDASAAFTGFRSYALLEAENPDEVSKGVSPLVASRVDEAVKRELNAKGLTEANSPDLLVNWYVGTEQKMDINTYSHGWGYYGWYGGTTTQVRNYTEGTLVIDLIDSKSKNLVWRGWATGTVEENANAEQRTRRINEVVGEIMKRYPPGA